MRISASGNVGIGTPTPTEKLEVSGDIRVGNIRLSASDIDDAANIRMIIDKDNNQTDQTFSVWTNGGSGTELFTIEENGNTAIRGQLDMDTHKIVNLKDPTENQDAATKNYVDDLTGGVPCWSLKGNTSTDPNTDYVGTIDNQVFVLRTYGQTGLRLEPSPIGDAWAPNLVGGMYTNAITSGVWGATIGGGGGLNYAHRVTDHWGTIGGGLENLAGDADGDSSNARCATVGGGWGNTASGSRATVAGGYGNLASGAHATVAGGRENLATGNYAIVVGGEHNTAQGECSFAAGEKAKANHDGSFVWADQSPLSDFASTADNQFLIRAYGGVGIGTNTPGEQLEVGRGNLKMTEGNIILNGNWLSGDGEDEGISVAADGSVATYGNVGIGTPNPGAQLHVSAAGSPWGSPQVLIESTAQSGDQTALGFKNTSNNFPYDWEFGINSIGALHLRDNQNAVDKLYFWRGQNGAILFQPAGGSVGIGTVSQDHELNVAGTTRTEVLEITAGTDLAEPFVMSDEVPVLPGMVVVIDDENAGNLKMSNRAYDKRVAGVVSGAGGVNPGLTLSQHGVFEDGQNVALAGRVYCLADAAAGSIEPGDLLTTSSTPGHAMKVSDYDQAKGAVIGKAMTSLAEGEGLVLVLVSLQ
jgi:hypothetical protein